MGANLERFNKAFVGRWYQAGGLDYIYKLASIRRGGRTSVLLAHANIAYDFEGNRIMLNPTGTNRDLDRFLTDDFPVPYSTVRSILIKAKKAKKAS